MLSDIRSFTEKALGSGLVYEDVSGKRVFVDGNHEPVRFLERTYWEALENVTLYILAQFATYLVKLQEERNWSKTAIRNTRYD